MNRRRAFAILASCSVESMGCARKQPEIMGRLRNLENREDLAIIGRSLTAFSVTGVRVGQLVLPDCCKSQPSVAPDGKYVCWIPSSARPYPPSPGNSAIYIVDGSHSIKTIPYTQGVGVNVVVSAKAAKIAVISISRSGKHTLLILDGETGELERDVSEVLTRLSLSNAERLQLSADGTCLVVGSRDEFAAIQVSSGSILFRGKGRFPAVSPVGESLVFVDENRLIVRSLISGTSRRLMQGWSTYGIGSWSPAGEFVIAGARTSVSLWLRLVVIDTVSDGFAEVGRLGEGDFGDRCSWVSRGLLTP